MTAQQQAAMQSMIEWLADERELGKEPSKIEIAGEFDLHDMHYYIFKYKKNMLGKWLLGVCGGYEEASDTEHCGHIFSEREPYDPATAEQQAIEMVERIRDYWMQQAAAYEAEQAQNEHTEDSDSASGVFNGFILLNSPECDMEQIKANLLEDWNIDYSQAEGAADSDSNEESQETLVFEVDGFMLAVSFVPAPIPDGEAEHFAKGNYLWREAEEVTKTHVAQIIIAVIDSSGGSRLEAGRFYTKLAASCLKLPNAVGIYTSGTVMQPEFFIPLAEELKTEEIFPLLNLVHFGLVWSETGLNGYTSGLNALGKDEIEVLNSKATPEELRDFLIDIAYYIVDQNVTLRDGETIGFSAEQTLPITRSQGVYVEGDSLKIGF